MSTKDYWNWIFPTFLGGAAESGVVFLNQLSLLFLSSSLSSSSLSSWPRISPGTPPPLILASLQFRSTPLSALVTCETFGAETTHLSRHSDALCELSGQLVQRGRIPGHRCLPVVIQGSINRVYSGTSKIQIFREFFHNIAQNSKTFSVSTIQKTLQHILSSNPRTQLLCISFQMLKVLFEMRQSRFQAIHF